MRKLQSSDVFAMFRLVKESGMRAEVQRIALMVNSGKKIKVNELGIDFILGVMEGCASVGSEQKMYEFLSGPLEMSVDDIKVMPPLELMNNIKALIESEDAESWKAFFGPVVSMMR